MQFGAKPLFENISVKFGDGNRYGLIGANGCGKTTFMKILGGDVEHAHVFVRELVLAQFAETLAPIDRDRTRARLEIAAEDFHERGFAAAVCADQSVAIALAKAQRDVFEEGLAPELHGDVGGAQHWTF